jgi:hypothetical protein
VDQPAFFEPFQSGGADPHLLCRLGNAHTLSCYGASPLFPGHSRSFPATCRPPSRTPHARARETHAALVWEAAGRDRFQPYNPLFGFDCLLSGVVPCLTISVPGQ